jgi:hypothetical protein
MRVRYRTFVATMSNFDQMPPASNDSLLRCPERDTFGPLPRDHPRMASPRPMGLRSGPLVTERRISRSLRWLCQPKFSRIAKPPVNGASSGSMILEIFDGHDARRQALRYAMRTYGQAHLEPQR